MTATGIFQRDVSLFERIALTATENYPPGANQLVLEGTGFLDADRWRAAVAKASQANPGSRLVLQNSWRGLRWVDCGKPPPVRVVEDGHWSGNDLKQAPFLSRLLPPDTGPTCEVVLIRGDPLRVAFRTLHSMMDLAGTMIWADEIFRALRQETLLGSRSTLTDFQFLQSLRDPKPRIVERHALGRWFPAPTGELVAGQPGFDYRRLRLQGPVSNFLGRLTLLIAQHARRHSPGDARFAVSVDLRRRRPEIRSTANLVRDVILDVAAQATADIIAGAFRRQLDSAQESVSWRLGVVFQTLPLELIRLFAKLSKMRWSRGQYRMTALVANMGRVSLERFSGGGFNSQAVFAIPPGHPSFPLFLAVFGYGTTLDFFATMPKGLASGGRLDRLLETIRAGLV